ncbi:hypothetical protein ACLIA0_07025 [Bacillaceae bacterium W0354]
MEKAMHQAHGFGYKEYCLKHEKRMEVERKRERDYQQESMVVAGINRLIYK